MISASGKVLYLRMLLNVMTLRPWSNGLSEMRSFSRSQTEQTNFELRKPPIWGGRGLEHLLRVAGREAQRASAVHDQFAQAHGDVADAVLRAFVADGVVVDRAGHARTGGEVQPVLLRAAHFLDDHGHLLLRDEVLRRLDVGPRRREIDRGVDAFDRLEQQAQHLVLVVDVGDHVGRVDAGEGLVVRVFELR